MDEPLEPFCRICYKTTGLRRCSKCRRAFYCSRECQKTDWPFHKPQCQQPSPNVAPVATIATPSEDGSAGINSDFFGAFSSPMAADSRQQFSNHIVNIGGSTTSATETIDAEPLSPLSAELLLRDQSIDALVDELLGEDQSQMASGSDDSLVPTMQLTGGYAPEIGLASPGVSSSSAPAICVPEEQLALEEMCRNLIRDMNQYGVCVLDNFLGYERGLRVLDEVTSMYSAGIFQDGQLVSNRSRNNSSRIRGDKITWVDGRDPAHTNLQYLINQVDAVITLANRMKNNGKLGQYNIRERTKAMVACYPGSGTHYVKHVDNPNRDGRCITAIYYLNLDWEVSRYGGLLRIFPDGCNDQVADIEPLFDRILFFWSDRRNPHEVQPAHKTRYAITLWYLDAREREMALRRYQRENLSSKK